MKPGRTYVMPFPTVRNRQQIDDSGLKIWRMDRLYRGQAFCAEVVFTQEMLRFDRRFCAHLLRRERRKMRAMAEART